MKSYTQGTENIKMCCIDPKNLGPKEYPDPTRKDLSFQRCQVCQCRHFEALADPGKFGLLGKSL